MLLIVVFPFLRLPELRVLGLELDVLNFLLCRLPRRSEAEMRDTQPANQLACS